MYHDNS